jgi:Flp pilus assembly protein protease CpaA
MDAELAIELCRIALSVGIMVFASIIDLEDMEVSDIPWFVGMGGGILLLIPDLMMSGLYLELIWIPILLALSYLIGYMGLFGGADVKCLFAIVLLNPKPPSFAFAMLPVALSLLVNSCILLLVLYPFIKKREEIPFLPIMTIALIVSYIVSDPISYIFSYMSLV